MKDRLFAGTDVAAALAEAVRTLGLPERELRYVVLEAGTPGGRGLQATPARIAVLLGDAGSGGGRGEPGRRAAGEVAAPEGRKGAAHEGIRTLVAALAGALGQELDCAVEDDGEVLRVELRGAGCRALYGDEGDGAPLHALEHLILRTWGEALRERLLRLRCEGLREHREAILGERALRLAAEVRRRGEAVLLEPMNSYERRLVHVALQNEAGVRTLSVGEGSERRVQILPQRAENAETEGRAERA